MIEIGLEALHRFARYLPAAFFTAAFMAYHRLLIEPYEFNAEQVSLMFGAPFSWLVNSQIPLIHFAGWAFLIGMLLFWMCLNIACIEITLLKLDLRYDISTLWFMGLICMLMGILYGGAVAISSSLDLVNLFWNLGLFCYGLKLLDHAERIGSIPSP